MIRARPIEKKTQNIKIKCLIFQKSIIWPKPIQNQYKPIQWMFVKHAPFCQNRPFWLCLPWNHQVCGWWLLNVFQGLVSTHLLILLSTWSLLLGDFHCIASHLWSCHEHQYLYEFSYDDEQEIFCFFLWWWWLLWLPIEYMFDKRDIARPI